MSDDNLEIIKDVEKLKSYVNDNINYRVCGLEDDVKNIKSQVNNHIPTAIGQLQRLLIGSENPDDIKDSIYEKVSLIDKHKVWLRFKPRTLLFMLVFIFCLFSLFYVEAFREGWLPQIIISVLHGL